MCSQPAALVWTVNSDVDAVAAFGMMFDQNSLAKKHTHLDQIRGMMRSW